MGGVAFLFAGQGAQHPAMGVDLIETSPAAAEVFAIADEVRPGTSEQCRSASKEELSQTENTQPCVFVHDLAVAVALRERGVVLPPVRDSRWARSLHSPLRGHSIRERVLSSCVSARH